MKRETLAAVTGPPLGLLGHLEPSMGVFPACPTFQKVPNIGPKHRHSNSLLPGSSMLLFIKHE